MKTTIDEVATIAGVSRTTVSFYLNGHSEKMSEATQEKIRKAIVSTNYHGLSKKLSNNEETVKNLIGVILTDATRYPTGKLLSGLDSIAKAKNYHLIICSTNSDPKREYQYIKLLMSMGAVGLVIQPSIGYENNARHLNIKIPVVLMGVPSVSIQSCWVKSNYYEAISSTVDLMIERGYQKFTLITDDYNTLVTRQERVSGFTDNLELRHIEYDTIIIDKTTNTETVKNLLSSHIDGKTPLCLFVFNDFLLPCVLQATMQYRSIIPQNLGIVGIDSQEWSPIVSPSITTVIHPSFEEGKAAAKIIIDQIENTHEIIEHQILKCQINEQDSTRRKNI